MFDCAASFAPCDPCNQVYHYITMNNYMRNRNKFNYVNIIGHRKIWSLIKLDFIAALEGLFLWIITGYRNCKTYKKNAFILSVLKISVDLLWAYWHSRDQEFLLSARPRECYTVYTMYGIHSDICFMLAYITSVPHFLLPVITDFLFSLRL